MDSPFLHHWLFHHAARTPEAPAVATTAWALSYGELASRVRALAGHLAATGVEPGSRVLVSLPNCPAAVVAGLAVNAVGGISVEVSREWSVDALRQVAERSRARHAIIAMRDARAWGEVLSATPVELIWTVDSGPVRLPATGALSTMRTALLIEDGRVDPNLEPAPDPPEVELVPDQPALVLYTSGSTGRPHGVIQTFGNIDANSRSIAEYLELTSRDRALLTLPLSYCYGRSVLQTHLLVGGSVYMDSRMAFPRVVLDAAARERCTGLAGVPLTFEVIRRQVDVSTIPLPHLRYLTQAGGAMAPETIAWVREAFAPAHLFVMYGQTEATARLSYLPPDRAQEKQGSVGVPIPGVTLRVVDANGRELPTGEVGELVARGGNITPGYLDDPAETSAILRDGWLWTGDLARQDDEGFIFLQGRDKEILKIGGHRASPVAIEQAVMMHPGVLDAAVLGTFDELLGERPVAVVVFSAGVRPTFEELWRHCRERLPAYEVPFRFIEAERLPRNESGKLLRGELARQYARDGQSQSGTPGTSADRVDGPTGEPRGA
jgi:long-chain acyl-CoA synthetase